MKKSYKVVFCFLWLSLPCLFAEEGEEARVKEIRQVYEKTESAELRRASFKFETEDHLDGSFTRFFSGEQVLKVHLSYTALGGHSAYNETYYYHEGQLIFIYAVKHSWFFNGKPQADGEPGATETLAQHRLYFDEKGNVIRHLVRRLSSDENPNTLRKDIAKAPQQVADPSKDADQQAARQLSQQGQNWHLIKDPNSLAKKLKSSLTKG